MNNERGAEGLYIEHRGRPATVCKEVEEDLIIQNQRLRAENAYLKNLNVLVLK